MYKMTLFNDAYTGALIIEYWIENNKLRPFQITSYAPHFENNRNNVKLVPKQHFDKYQYSHPTTSMKRKR